MLRQALGQALAKSQTHKPRLKAARSHSIALVSTSDRSKEPCIASSLFSDSRSTEDPRLSIWKETASHGGIKCKPFNAAEKAKSRGRYISHSRHAHIDLISTTPASIYHYQSPGTSSSRGNRSTGYTARFPLISQSLQVQRLRSELVEDVSRSQWRTAAFHTRSQSAFSTKPSGASREAREKSSSSKGDEVTSHSQWAVQVALGCNFAVFLGKLAVFWHSQSSVMLAEAVHSAADLANQSLLAYGIFSSKRAPDKWHPYGYSKERFIWALISAVGIFCCGSGVSIVHGIHCLMAPEQLENFGYGYFVLGLSALMEGTSMVVAYRAVKQGAIAEGMSMRDYLWRGHDPTSVAVLMEDGAAVAGLGIAAFCLAAVQLTGNPIWDAGGSIAVGALLGAVAVFLIQRNRSALLGRSMDDDDMQQLMRLLKSDPVVHAIYDCKSEVIGPGEFRFKAEVDFSGPAVVQNYLKKMGRKELLKEVEHAVAKGDSGALSAVMERYGAALVGSIGDEIDRLEQVIQKELPEVRHVDIEAHSRYGRPAR